MKKRAKKKPFNPYMERVDIEEFRRIIREMRGDALAQRTPRITNTTEVQTEKVLRARRDVDLDRVLKRLHFKESLTSLQRERLWMNLAIRLTREPS